MGALNSAVPFWLLSFGETRLDSGLTAVIQAAAPIFTVLIAMRYDPSQRASGARLAGVLVGFAGVALLVGAQEGGDLVAALAIAGAAACYAMGALFGGRRLGAAAADHDVVRHDGRRHGPDRARRPPPAPARDTGLEAGRLRRRARSARHRARVHPLLRAVLGAGASKAILVTYLVPAMALLYGAVFLDEAVTAVSLAGLALVLAGVALGTGAIGRARATR